MPWSLLIISDVVAVGYEMEDVDQADYAYRKIKETKRKLCKGIDCDPLVEFDIIKEGSVIVDVNCVSICSVEQVND